MRILLLTLALALIVVITAVFLHNDAGSVTATFMGGEYSSPLVYVFFGLLFGAFVLYWFFRLLGMLFNAPKTLGKARNRRAADAANHRLVAGFLALDEGQSERAEKLLTKDAPVGDMGALHYLQAADAAGRQGRADFRDRYLQRAAEAHPGAAFSVAMRQARIALDGGDARRAAEIAQGLVRQQNRNSTALDLLTRAQAELGDWGAINKQLPELRKRQLLDGDRLDELEVQTGLGTLAASDDAALESQWRELAAAAKSQGAVVRQYATRLADAGKGEQAERVLRTALDQRWDGEALRSYTALSLGKGAERQLDQVEKWLADKPEDPALLAAAGQLCVKQELWGKAASYLEQAAQLGDNPAVRKAMATVADAKGDSEAAREHLRHGLSLATRR